MKTYILSIASLIVVNSIAQDYTSYFTGNPTDIETFPTGGVCLMGGATEHDEAMKWFLQEADGGDILVLRASGSDGYNDYMYSELGVTVNSVETIVFNNANASLDPYIHDKISKAEAIWFAGGDQWNYVSYWRGTDIESLINEAITTRGIAIGGTSAGMAIMGSHYFSAENGTVTSAEALADPYASNVTPDGTPFLVTPWLFQTITDSHFDSPDRRGRLAVFLARIATDEGVQAHGIACNEYTAVCIDFLGQCKVYGDYPNYDEFAYFVKVDCNLVEPIPEMCMSGMPLTWTQDGPALKAYKVPGTMNGANTFNLDDWETGTGGTWMNWSVINGVFTEIVGLACSAGIDEKDAPQLDMFPNPANQILNVRCESTIKSISIEDLTGKEMSLYTHLNEESKSIDISKYPSGVYIISIENEAGKAFGKFVKE